MPNLLAQVREVGLELDRLGLQRRPANIPGLCVIASTTDESWLVLAHTGEDMDLTGREPLARALQREFDLFAASDLPNWRNVFAMSSRLLPADLAILQSRKTFSQKDAAGIARPHYEATMQHLRSCLGSHVADSIDHQADFLLTHSMRKSDSFTMPVPLARYALMFYLSSPYRQSRWVMVDGETRGLPSA